MQFTDTSEKALQKFIANYLTDKNFGHSFLETTSAEFDAELCLNTKQLMQFIENTQKETYDTIQRKGERAFLVRLDEKIKELGVIQVLQKGIKHLDKNIDLFYRKPSSIHNAKDAAKYQANCYTVTQELIYSLDHKNRLDLTIFINGIPIITCELKNPLSGQTVANAIRQYKSDRDPKDKIL